MSDPIRLADDEANADARELLLAARASKLPDSERRALWASIALSVPAPLPPSTPLAARSSLGAYLTKGALFLAALGGLIFGVARMTQKAAPAPVAQAVKTVAASPATSSPTSSAGATPPAPVAAPTPSLRPRVAPVSQLREESLALIEARTALRSGDASRALSLLEQARARFPRGALGQEREALTVEALAKAGQRAAAQQRARSFVRAHPDSPYVADLCQIAEP